MSQQPGGQRRSDPTYSQQPPGDPYYGQQPDDPYAQQRPADPSYGQPSSDPRVQQTPQQPYYGPPAEGSRTRSPSEESGSRGGVGAAMVGILLVVLGVWFLFRDEIALDFGRLWPMLAVGLGVIMVIAAFMPRRRR